MKKLILLITSLGIVGYIMPVFAIKMDTLYQASAPVASQSAEDRAQILQQALGDVLIKVSGNDHVLDDAAVRSQLEAANNLMQEYSYQRSGNGYILQVSFDPDGVNRLLAKASVPIWGKNRPLLMVWAVYEAPQNSAVIISDDGIHGISTVLKQNMAKRGLPVIFPMMDVQDMNLVAPTDIFELSAPTLKKAAKRYACDALLVGRIIAEKNGYVSRWTLLLGGDQWTWNIAGATKEDLLNTLTNYTADTLAGRYAVAVSRVLQAKLMLKITGITETNDLDSLVGYIKHIASVMDVEPIQILGSEAVVRVKVQGSQQSFTEALALGKRLTLQPSPSDSDLLVYEWNH